MTDSVPSPAPDAVPAGEQISSFVVAGTLLRGRRRIGKWVLIGGCLGLIPVIIARSTYTATATFVPQSSGDDSHSSLASLAGQFGISVGGGSSQTQSPQFYADLLLSRVILAPLADESFVVDSGKPARTLPSLVGVTEKDSARRVDLTVEALTENVLSYDISKETGVISLRVKTKWRSLSLAIENELLTRVNAFNLHTQQTSATAERVFTEARLADAKQSLRQAEDQLEAFLQRNRQYQNSPELQFAHDRLQRVVDVQQGVVTSLTQNYEDVRIREVRDTPVITILQQPAVPVDANWRPWLFLAIGLPFGAILGTMLVLASEILRRLRTVPDPETRNFFVAYDDTLAALRRLIPRRRKSAPADR